MVYPEYESYRIKYNRLQERFADVLMEKERLFTKTLPNAITYDRDVVQTSIDGNPLEEYVCTMDEKQIDEKIAKLRESLKDWTILLDMKEKELRKSLAVPDKVYLMRYIECYSISRISRSINYSKSQTYRVIKQIEKKCEKMKQKGTKCDK